MDILFPMFKNTLKHPFKDAAIILVYNSKWNACMLLSIYECHSNIYPTLICSLFRNGYIGCLLYSWCRNICWWWTVVGLLYCRCHCHCSLATARFHSIRFEMFCALVRSLLPGILCIPTHNVIYNGSKPNQDNNVNCWWKVFSIEMSGDVPFIKVKKMVIW